MLRLWGRMIRDNHLLKDATVERDDDTRTHCIMRGLGELCMLWDLPEPIWLEKNIEEFKRHSKTRFYQDSFIERLDFDYLEIRVLEEQ